MGVDSARLDPERQLSGNLNRDMKGCNGARCCWIDSVRSGPLSAQKRTQQAGDGTAKDIHSPLVLQSRDMRAASFVEQFTGDCSDPPRYSNGSSLKEKGPELRALVR